MGLKDGPDLKYCSCGPEFVFNLSVAWSFGAQLVIFFCFGILVALSEPEGSPGAACVVSIESSSLIYHGFYPRFLFPVMIH